MKSKDNYEILADKFTKIEIETDEKNPITIAVITNSDVETIIGYRIKLTPSYD